MTFRQNGNTSVKVQRAPGGNSSFSLAWDMGPNPETIKKDFNKTNQNFYENTYQVTTLKHHPTNDDTIKYKNVSEETQEKNVRTGVRVKNPPGGRSTFTLG